MQPEVRVVEATVHVVISELHQERVVTKDGFEYAITRHTTGVRWDELHEGQHLLCTVTVRLPRVLSARVLG